MILEDIFKGGTEGIFKGVSDIVKDFKADPTEVLKIQHEVDMAKLQMEQALTSAQDQVNQIEAGNARLFVSGWRPFVGWICGVGLCYQFLTQPLLAWASAIWQIPVPPSLDGNTLMTVLFGMLGLGAMRSFDKNQGSSVGH